jgi:hypothetical protein
MLEINTIINHKFIILFLILIVINTKSENSKFNRKRKYDKNKHIIKNKKEKIKFPQPLKLKKKLIIKKTNNKKESKVDKKTISIKDNKNKSNDSFINPFVENEQKYYDYFLSLKKMPKNKNSPIIENEKNEILQNISANVGSIITSLDEIYFNNINRFGNGLIMLNKLIFFCEILGVKKILINKDNNLYINKTIYDKEYNLSIEINDNMNIENQNVIFDQLENPIINQIYTFTNYFPNLFYIFFNLRIENRFNVFKNEILNNLPKVKIDPKDLYIHIRGGDIFSEKALDKGYSSSYAQYPLCFYSKIIENYKFKKIYIISADKLNPMVNKLLNKYKNITYNKNSLEKDIALLAHAYNVVGSVSSFVISIIKLNDNLKNFWEYDIYQMEHRLYHMHHSLYDYPRNYTIYRMKPSELYQIDMYIWKRSDEQINIMLNDKCPNKFKIIFPHN